METLGFGINDESTTYDQEQANQQGSRLTSIQRCIRCLVHSCQCRDRNCQLPSCNKMKRVVQHAKCCREKTTDCPICKQLLALSLHHAKNCQMLKCPVPFCINITNKIKHQQLKQRLQQAQNLKRRIDGMLQTSPGTSKSSSQPSPAAQPYSSPQLGSPLQVMSNPDPAPGGMQKHIQAWQRLLQVLKAPPSAQQQRDVLAILRSNPKLMAAFIKQRAAQQQQNEGNSSYRDVPIKTDGQCRESGTPTGGSQTVDKQGQQSSDECIICYEKTVDCALYRCGHTCMCYNCAFKLWKSNSSSHCPICRSSIQDVIKIYK